MCQSIELRTSIDEIRKLRWVSEPPAKEVLERIANLGILAKVKYNSVCCDIRRLARRTSNRPRGKRAGKGGNREEQRKRRQLKVIQWNVNGWKTTADLVRNDFANVDVLMLSESWLKDKVEIENFETVCSDGVKLNAAGRRSGGLITAIRNGIEFDTLKSNRFVQHLLLRKRKLHLINAYFPPVTVVDSKRAPFPVDAIFESIVTELRCCEDDPVIVAGDFNCRIDGKYSERGTDLMERLKEVGYALSFEPTVPTFYMSNGSGTSIVDLCFSNIQDKLTGHKVVRVASSDHCMIESSWSIGFERRSVNKASLPRALDIDKLTERITGIKIKAKNNLKEGRLTEAFECLADDLTSCAVKR